MIRANIKKFSEALSIGTRCCGNGIMPILNCVLIEAKDGRVHLTSTNLDMLISTSFEATNKGETESICIYGKRLATIVSAMSGDELSMEISKSQRMRLKGGPSDFNIMGISPADFPARAQPVNPVSFSLSQAKLSEFLQATSDAQSDDKTRWAINGVNVSFDGGKISLVATDGRRMHCITTASSMVWPTSTIPRSTVDLIEGLLDATGNVRFDLVKSSTSPGSVWITIERPAGHIVIQSKLVDVAFPNWKQVLPKGNDLKYEVVREEMISTLRRVSLALDEKSSGVHLKFGGLGLNMSGSSASNGEAEEMVACSGPAGDYEIVLSEKFLMDALNSTNAKEVTLSLNTKQPSVSPLLVAAGDAKAVVMPLRLS